MSVSVFMVFVDGTVVNTALPSIARDLQASTATLQWVADGYILILAGTLLAGGTIGDKFGRKRWLTIGMVVFGAGAIGAALAQNAETLILFCGVQGLGAALVLPATLSILTAVFPRNERSKAIGIWTGVGGLGVAFGPVGGGFLVDEFNWSAVFWLLIPIVVVSLVGMRWVPESRDRRQLGVDVPGAVLATLGLVALVFAIIQGNEEGWGSPLIIIAFALAAGLLAAFALVEARSATPMLPLRFFRQRDFSAAVAIIGLAFFAMFGLFFFMTQYFQLVQGRSALDAGLLILPAAGAMMVSAPIAGILSQSIGPKVLATIGMVIIAGGLLLLTQLEVSTGIGLPIGAIFMFGFGVGLSMAPLTDTVMAAVPVDDSGVGSAVNDVSRELGGALGIAVVGAVVSGIYRSDVEEALTGAVPPELVETASDGIGIAVVAAQQLPADVAATVFAAANPAFVGALTDGLIVSIAFAVAAAVVAALFVPWKMRTEQAQERNLEPETLAAVDALTPATLPAAPHDAAAHPAHGFTHRFVSHCYGFNFLPINRCG